MNKLGQKIFDYAVKEGKQFYFENWVPKDCRCRAFDDEIVGITREGWEHVVEDTRRHWLDIIARIAIFERAKKLLEEAEHFQKHKEVGDREYWIFEAEIEEIVVRVVVRSINKGPKHLYSIIPKSSVAGVVKRGTNKK